VIRVLSVDIDGTLEIGEPPGIVPIAFVRAAKASGWIVGSCSDRPISDQEGIWERLAIVPDFTALKHRLDEVRARFPAAAYYHIGDTDTDRFYARAAGFHFLSADALAHRTWGAELFPTPEVG
jgi:hypothetical protein